MKRQIKRNKVKNHQANQRRGRLQLERLESRIALAADYEHFQFYSFNADDPWGDEFPILATEESWFSNIVSNEPHSAITRFTDSPTKFASFEQIDQVITGFDFETSIDVAFHPFRADLIWSPEVRYEAVELLFSRNSFSDSLISSEYDDFAYDERLGSDMLRVENFGFELPILAQVIQPEVEPLRHADLLTFQSEPILTFPMRNFITIEEVAMPATEVLEFNAANSTFAVEFNQQSKSLASSASASNRVTNTNVGVELTRNSSSQEAATTVRPALNPSSVSNQKIGESKSIRSNSILVVASAVSELQQTTPDSMASATSVPGATSGPATNTQVDSNLSLEWATRTHELTSPGNANVSAPAITHWTTPETPQMSERMRSLGMRLLRDATGSSQVGESHRIDDAPSSFLVPSQLGVSHIDWLPGFGETAHSLDGRSLFIGEPIAALHAFEDFNIFEITSTEVPLVESESLTTTSYASLLLAVDISNVTRLLLCVGAFSVFGYLARRRHALQPTKGGETEARILFGHQTYLDDESLNFTKPIVLKLSM